MPTAHAAPATAFIAHLQAKYYAQSITKSTEVGILQLFSVLPLL